MDHCSTDPILSTRKVAAILGAEPTSVMRWFDRGLLRGWRTPGGHRRVRASSVVAYLKAAGMDVPAELSGVAPESDHGPNPVHVSIKKSRGRRLLWVDSDASYLLSIGRRLRHEKGIEAVLSDSIIEALLEFASIRPHCVFIATDTPGADAIQVCRTLKSWEGSARSAVVLIANDDSTAMRSTARDAGASELWTKPLDWDVALRFLRASATA